jgi:hypothetical protein
MDKRLGRLPRPAWNHPGSEQPLAGLLQGVVPALWFGAHVLGAGLRAEGGQHRRQRGGAARRQVPRQPPCPAERDPQPQSAFLVWGGAILIQAEPLAHLLGQARQVTQARAAAGGGGEDLVGVASGVLGEPVAPGTQLLGP